MSPIRGWFKPGKRGGLGATPMRVMQFAQTWSLDPASNIDWASMSDVVLQDVTPEADGSLSAGGGVGGLPGVEWATQLTAQAKASGVTPWVGLTAMEPMMAGDVNRRQYMINAMQSDPQGYADRIIAMAQTYGAQGVMIDLEPYIPTRDMNDPGGKTTIALLTDLGNRLRGRGILTGICSGEFNRPFEQYQLRAPFFAAWDRHFLMCYDMSWPYGGQGLWHNAPLFGEAKSAAEAGAGHQPMSVSWDIQYCLLNGAQPEQLIVGTGAYALGANGPQRPGDAWTEQQKVGNGDSLTYEWIQENLSKFATKGFDPVRRVPWASSPTPIPFYDKHRQITSQVTYISWQDEQALTELADYARSKGVTQLGCWAHWYSDTYNKMLAKVARVSTQPAPTTVAAGVQRTYSSLSAAVTDMGLPPEADTRYVTFDSAKWATLNAAHDSLAAQYPDGNTILVLPEAKVYDIDLSKGVRAPGVTSVDGWEMFQPGGRAFFAVTRGLRGIVGLNEGTRIGFINPGGWQAPRQGKSIAEAAVDGSTPWGYVKTDGTRVAFSDAGASILQFDHADAHLANVSFAEAPDLGGLSFGLTSFLRNSSSAKATIQRVTAQGSWRGHAGVPNGETGAIQTNAPTYEIRDCLFDGATPAGVKLGSSPIMVNSSTGGAIRRTKAINSVKGMPTIWKSSGTHLLEDFTSTGNASQSLNIEACLAGTVIDVRGGHFGAGGNKMHLGVGGVTADVKVQFTGTTFDLANSMWPGKVSVQLYTYGGTQYQKAASITAVDTAGATIPVQVAL